MSALRDLADCHFVLWLSMYVTASDVHGHGSSKNICTGSAVIVQITRENVSTYSTQDMSTQRLNLCCHFQEPVIHILLQLGL